MNAKKLSDIDVSNPDLKSVVKTDNSLKEMFVNYVGTRLQPKDGNVTVEMIVEVLSQEFPEFLMVVAEENFIRGYEQALADVEYSPTGSKKGKKKK